MSNNVLILLCLLYREKGFLQALGETVRVIIILLIPTFKRRELRVHTHQPCHTSYILINKPSDEVNHTCIFRFRPDIQQANVLRIQIPAEPFKKPKMRRQLSTVQVFEACEDLQILPIEVFSSPFGVSHARIPQILIQQRDVLLNGRREVSIVGNIAPHPLSIVVVNFIKDDVYSFLQLTLRLAV